MDSDKKILPSILDRLIDEDPSTEHEINKSYHHYLSEFRESIRRDLEALMNNRQRCVFNSDDYEYLQDSIPNYGLPDLASQNFVAADSAEDFCQEMANALLRFEPRFKSVEVRAEDMKNKIDRMVKFTIEAIVYADPAPERIVFDSEIESVTRVVSIKER